MFHRTGQVEACRGGHAIQAKKQSNKSFDDTDETQNCTELPKKFDYVSLRRQGLKVNYSQEELTIEHTELEVVES